MASSDVKLLGSGGSSYVNRVQIALNLKSVDFELLEEKFGSKSELLLKSNPVHKKFPVLIHGDKPICESLIIVQYIDEVWTSGPSILPSDPYDRAMARFWAAYIDEKWFPALNKFARGGAEEAKTVVEGLSLLEDAFVKCSKGKTFFAVDRIGYLDIALGCFLAWIKVIEMMGNLKLLDEAKTPHLVKWADDFCADPSVKDVMPETEKLAEFAKVFLAQPKAATPSK